MNEINDIKDLVEIPDFSIFIFIFLCILAVLIFSSLVFLIYKKIKNKKVNHRKKYYEILKEIDLSNAKEASYKISKYLRLLEQSEREKNLIADLILELEEYKYKKEVKAINKEIVVKFEIIMDTLDV